MLSGELSRTLRHQIVKAIRQDKDHRIHWRPGPEDADEGFENAGKQANGRPWTDLLRSRIVFASEAAGKGVNLQRVSQMICLDLMWTPATMIQIKGRMVRRFQRFQVSIYYVVVSGSPNSLQLDITTFKRFHKSVYCTVTSGPPSDNVSVNVTQKTKTDPGKKGPNSPKKPSQKKRAPVAGIY